MQLYILIKSTLAVPAMLQSDLMAINRLLMCSTLLEGS